MRLMQSALGSSEDGAMMAGSDEDDAKVVATNVFIISSSESGPAVISFPRSLATAYIMNAYYRRTRAPGRESRGHPVLLRR